MSMPNMPNMPGLPTGNYNNFNDALIALREAGFEFERYE